MEILYGGNGTCRVTICQEKPTHGRVMPGDSSGQAFAYCEADGAKRTNWQRVPLPSSAHEDPESEVWDA